jgi:hypothetical protein
MKDRFVSVRFPICLLLAALTVVTSTRAEEKWANLFDGKSLKGWIQRGGKAGYSIEHDAIVGSSVCDTGNSFLCTERQYSDFILEYDFKVDPRLNSGVQIRSECFDVPKTIQWQGKDLEIPAQRVHGYQVEIDPNISRGRLWSGGIFDESRRGWLFPGDGVDGPEGKAFSEQGRRILKPQDWNHIRVEAKGDSIKTWLNGTACAAIKDGLTPRGFVALQVHRIRDDKEREGAQVRWRNIRIKEMAATDATRLNVLTDLEKAAGWRLLWDGKTMDGWRSAKAVTFPIRGWEIADGALTVKEGTDPESVGKGSIITSARFSSFEMVADFKLTPGANSGIKYFVQLNGGPDSKPGASYPVGCEFQILDDALHPDAKLGHDGDRTVGSLYDLIPPVANKKTRAISEWNTARILVQGNYVEHWLNGKKVLAYERGSAAFRATVAQSKFKNIPGFGEWKDGHILLQEHGNQVQFRNIKIRDLPAN